MKQILYHNGHDVFAVGEHDFFGRFHISCPTLGFFGKAKFEDLTKMGWEFVCNV